MITLTRHMDSIDNEFSQCLEASDYKRAQIVLIDRGGQTMNVDCMYMREFGGKVVENPTHTPCLEAHGGTGGNNQPILCNEAEKIVRRMTPLEYERLQGFPDGWTDIPETIVNGKKVKCTDSARYKALGNSICTPFWQDLLEGVTIELEKDFPNEQHTLGSLFDGIGGFPYVWEKHNGVRSARWGSEIEPFPIAVTMYHFPEV